LALYYPKCKPGWVPRGCNICGPQHPDCEALGLSKSGVHGSCRKKVKVGRPLLGQCESSQDRDAGLCYSKCGSGFNGVGPVCWGQPPSGWVNCGMGAASSSSKCATHISNQLISVGTLAMTVASMGTVQAGKGPSSGNFAEIKKKFDQAKEAWNKVKNNPQVKAAIDKASAAKEVYSDVAKKSKPFVDMATQDGLTAADMVRITAEMAAIVDSSGVSQTVAAYSYPKCSKVR
jgi:hypothetical protein